MIESQKIPVGSPPKQHPLYGEVVVISLPFEIGGEEAVWIVVRDQNKVGALPSRLVVAIGDLA